MSGEHASVKALAATCAVCQQPILIEIGAITGAPDGVVGAPSAPALRAAAEAHLRMHPAPILERFWLRQYMEDIRRDERAAAVQRIYQELRQLWGSYDSQGAYGIDEALGSASVYSLWLDAERCAYRRCQHAPSADDAPIAARRQLGCLQRLRSVFSNVLPSTSDRWAGSSGEWRALWRIAARHCCCASGPDRPCRVHRLFEDQRTRDRLLFARRIAAQLQREEMELHS